MADKAKSMEESDILSVFDDCRSEAKDAKVSRMALNADNFAAYHMNQNWDYKQAGQSREFLPKQSMATEQGSNFIRQGLIDLGDWFSVDAEEGLNADSMPFRPEEVRRLLNRQLDKNSIVDKVADSIKLGFLGSLMIAKVGGKWVPKVRYEVKKKWYGASLKKKLVKIEDKVWQLDISLGRQEDYFPDPTGRGLYEIYDTYMDFHAVEALSKGDDAIYLPDIVEKLRGSSGSDNPDQQWKKAQETGQNSVNRGYRNTVKISEYWGNLLNSEGELIYENIVFTVANDMYLIQEPTSNPLWHGESPFVVAPILTVPHSVWHKALMDAPTTLNRAINEMYNLILDGGLMSVHGIKQISEHYLEDPSQVENGIPAGTTLKANQQTPPGVPVLQSVGTSTVPPEALAILNLTNQEFYASAITNDLRMGVQANAATKATAIVEASQSISGMFTGIAKQIESNYITPLLAKSWKTIAQHTSEMDPDNLRSLFGTRRAEALLGLTNQDLFAATVQGCKFNVFGISATLQKQKDFTKIQGLMQTVASSPVLMEAFAAKYDFGKLLGEIMKSLDINPSKIAKDDSPQNAKNPEPPAPEQAQQGMPDQQSQIPQAMAAGNNPDPVASQAQAGVPATEFPGSKATQAASPIPRG